MIDRRAALKRITAILGGTLSASTVAGVLAGCQASGPAAGFRTLTGSQKALLDALTETIIPETDTPGAKTANVTSFIDAMLTDFYSDEERVAFFTGLDALDARANQELGDDFVKLDASNQFALLDTIDAATYPDLDAMSEAERLVHQQKDRPFFATLKGLTLSGYYTSEVGATQELHVNPMGEYRGDIPFDEVGKAWA